MPERPIKVPLSARSSEDDYKGLNVKEAYYTAGYQEDSDARYVAPMNHSGTYVVDGASFGINQDILLRTGNGLIKIKPEARVILDTSEEDGFRIYRTVDLPLDVERSILERLGLFEEYNLMEAFGTKPHFDKMNAMREALKEAANDN